MKGFIGINSMTAVSSEHIVTQLVLEICYQTV